MFIVLEGIDGSGLTTQSHRLHQALHVAGHEVLLTKEPTKGPIGTLLRQTLSGERHWAESSVALLFAADRLDHLEHTIAPSLARGQHVVSDRYYLSTLAYQALRVPEPWLRQINALALVPDITVFIDLPVEAAVQRIAQRGAALEVYEQAATLEKIRANYLRLLEHLIQAGQCVITVDGRPGVASVERAILSALLPRVHQLSWALPTLGESFIG